MSEIFVKKSIDKRLTIFRWDNILIPWLVLEGYAPIEICINRKARRRHFA